MRANDDSTEIKSHLIQLSRQRALLSTVLAQRILALKQIDFPIQDGIKQFFYQSDSFVKETSCLARTSWPAQHS